MVDRIPRGWLPPRCTNPKCKYHNHMGGPWPVRKVDFYTRKSDRRSVQRFHCRACGVTMSTQSFSTTYRQKRPDRPDPKAMEKGMLEPLQSTLPVE